MRRVNGWLAIFWIVMIPGSMTFGWLNSVVYVSALSLWALVSGHWSASQAARVEVAQQQESQQARHRDVPGEIVDRLIRKTDVEPDPAATERQPDSDRCPSAYPARRAAVTRPTCDHAAESEAPADVWVFRWETARRGTPGQEPHGHEPALRPVGSGRRRLLCLWDGSITRHWLRRHRGAGPGLRSKRRRGAP